MEPIKKFCKKHDVVLLAAAAGAVWGVVGYTVVCRKFGYNMMKPFEYDDVNSVFYLKAVGGRKLYSSEEIKPG